MMLSNPPYSTAACMAKQAYPGSLYVSRNTVYKHVQVGDTGGSLQYCERRVNEILERPLKLLRDLAGEHIEIIPSD